MAFHTFILIRTVIRMLFNQFKRTLRNPSMLAFYSITVLGAFFVSLVISEIGRLGPMLEGTLFVLEEFVDRSVVFTVIGLATISTMLAGYFGVGPAALFIESVEYVLMPSPVKPYQLFLAKYVNRIIRKVFIIAIIILALFPLLGTLNFLAASLIILIVSWITFSEVNFFLGGISSYIRNKLETY